MNLNVEAAFGLDNDHSVLSASPSTNLTAAEVPGPALHRNAPGTTFWQVFSSIVGGCGVGVAMMLCALWRKGMLDALVTKAD